MRCADCDEAQTGGGTPGTVRGCAEAAPSAIRGQPGRGVRWGHRGSSLIEILAAMSIFTIVATALLASTLGTIRSNTHSRRVTVAVSLIQDRMEQFRHLDVTIPAHLAQIVDGSLNGVHGEDQVDELGNPDGPYRRRWEVRPNTPSFGVAEIEVTVEWNDRELRSISNLGYVCYTTTCS